MNRLRILSPLLAPAFVALGLVALGPAARAATLFSEDFEAASGLGDGKWATIGNAVLANAGYNSVKACKFSAKGYGGDLWSVTIAVSPNTTYWISCDYKLTGQGGYFGYEEFTNANADLGETWNWGDGGYTSQAVFNGAGAAYHHYVQSFTTKATTGKIQIKLEDWGGNAGAVGNVYFDNIGLTTTNPATVTTTVAQWREVVR